MPFTVTKPQPGGKLYIKRQPDGELFWTGEKRHATPFADADAEWVADHINRYASTPCQVEGVKHDDEVAA